MARHAPPARVKANPATVAGSSPTIPPPLPTGWPTNGWALLGSYCISASDRWDDITSDQFIWMLERQIMMPQHFAPQIETQQQQTRRHRKLKNGNPNLKICPYIAYTSVRRLDEAGTGYAPYFRDMMNSGSRGGGEDWWLHDENGNRLESMFSSRNQRINQCTQFTGVNSFGRNLPQQAMSDWWDLADATNPEGRQADYIDGVYLDVVPPAPQKAFVDGVSPRVSSKQDFNNDGVSETLDDGGENIPSNPDNEAGYGGTRMYRRALAKFPQHCRDFFGSGFAVTRNSTRDGLDYSAGVLGGSTNPVSTSEFYQVWDGGIYESAHSGFGIRENATNGLYDIAFGGGFGWVFRFQERIKSSTNPTTHPWMDGTNDKYVVAASNIYDTKFHPTRLSTDFNAIRFFGGVCALNAFCYGPQDNHANLVESPDEYLYDWGDTVNPYLGVDGDRHRMGTLDPTVAVNNVNADWSGNRPYDYEDGAAKFWWAEFENCIWVVRADIDGLGGSGTHGDGTAVACQLPNPGAGKVWKHFNTAVQYTNPNTGWQTRGQNNTLNDGGAVGAGGSYGTTSLLPYFAVMLVRDDA